MPSPLAHLTAGYVIYEVFRRNQTQQEDQLIGSMPRLLLLAGVLSILPDIDSVIGILAGDFGRFHNNATHSLIVGFAVALFVGVVASWRRWAPFWFLFTIALLAYETHVIMDALTIGRGVMAFWPISSARILSPVPIFYGFHWSDGLISWQHLITLVTEIVFGAVIITLAYLIIIRRNRQSGWEI